ncbi:type II TA system antitoxin MqsA family protein [Cystobacter ferrugineus]|uniref:HTH cro/C1-type domain-containing protein n=1 Tax=Cystobacter ferrugineus TaxID=83449 RepID=A0A1L9B0Y8_9BACT|nr:type II TA system antitoxin MqsA family protein [Cystobacter ferrugineus]OJH35922.1 hypothetical protein BON30_35500 [Cystobacter ferrugineus]
MECLNCGGKMETRRENHRYTESGLDNVTLVGVEVRRCATCGEWELVLPRVEALHRSLALTLVRKRTRLTAKEVRFLRKYLGFSGEDFARRMHVAPETVSRWETGKQDMGWTAEMALRLMVVHEERMTDYHLAELEEVDVEKRQSELMAFQSVRTHWEPTDLGAQV